MSSSGWLAVKKRGQDDDLIEEDARAALAARRAKRSKKKDSAGPNKKAVRGKKHRPINEDDDDDDSFVVDDDEDIEIESYASSSEDELVVLPEKKKSVPAPAHGNERKVIRVESMSSSSDDEAGTFLPSYKPRISRPPPKPVAKGRIASGARKGSSKQLKPAFRNGKSDARPHNQTPKPVKPARCPLEADILSIDDTPKVSAKENGSTTHMDDDSPFPPLAARKRPPGKIHRTLYDSSDDEFPETKVAAPVKLEPAHKPLALSSDDYVEDDDEQLAIMLATEESLKDLSPPHRQHPANANDSDHSVASSAGDEEGDEPEDEYIGVEARAARSVLAVANELSTKVLRKMMSWSSQHSDSSSPTQIPVGMIVDGALALTSGIGNSSTPAKGKSNSKSADTDDSHHWISHDQMKEICPNFTLAEYQLIGVNWLALLHGMKVRMSGRKSFTTVNGILADQMGLGKTGKLVCGESRHSSRKFTTYALLP
jgi:hypothetical protein